LRRPSRCNSNRWWGARAGISHCGKEPFRAARRPRKDQPAAFISPSGGQGPIPFSRSPRRSDQGLQIRHGGVPAGGPQAVYVKNADYVPARRATSGASGGKVVKVDRWSGARCRTITPPPPRRSQGEAMVGKCAARHRDAVVQLRHQSRKGPTRSGQHDDAAAVSKTYIRPSTM